MPLERPDFDQLAESDLEELVTAGVAGGPRIDYKRDPYGLRVALASLDATMA